jgi:diguanylate cyclase (GGDEF)-like protein
MKVLVAEDNPIVQSLLRSLLTKWNYEVVLARSGTEAWDLLQSDTGARLAILDWMMPGLDGIEVCRRVRAQKGDRYVYVILLSARAEQEDIVEALEAGADDYITKPFHPGELRARMRSAVRVVQLEENLARQAHYDSLTGLPNRVLLADRLEQALLRANRHAERVGFFYIDLDRFKVVNDSLGHAAGDALLEAVARRLQTCVRECDTLARVGGDEFALVVGGLEDAAEAAVVSARILSALDAPFEIVGRQLRVTASIGATIYPEDGADVSSLQQNADAAMYESKRRARHGFQFFHAAMGRTSRRQLDMEQKLAVAVEKGEISLHYQPVYGLGGGGITALEALARWHSPELGGVPPQVFVALAEETGNIVALGAWVLEEACRQAQEWVRGGMPRAVTVNVSALQLAEPGYVDTVAGTLRRTALDPRLLKLEVTETVLMRDFEKVAATLGQLRGMGIEIWVDDFGTGYSCFSHLHRLPVDVIKIAREFVRDIGKHHGVLPLVRGIVTLAHNLGLQTVAEGVETAAQLAAVESAGCDHVQGFLLGRPRPAQDVDWTAPPIMGREPGRELRAEVLAERTEAFAASLERLPGAAEEPAVPPSNLATR